MKTLSTDFYHIKEKLYYCKGCDIRFDRRDCPNCGSTGDDIKMIVPEVGDEVIYVGAKQYDIITYEGESMPVWVDWWGVLDLKPLD